MEIKDVLMIVIASISSIIVIFLLALFLSSLESKNLCPHYDYGTDEKDGCLMNMSIKTSESRYCKAMSSQEKNIICLEELAIRNQDVSFCYQMTSSYDSTKCAIRLAKDMNDEKICAGVREVLSGLTYNKDWCYRELAKYRGQLQICYKIVDDITKNKCFGEV